MLKLNSMKLSTLINIPQIVRCTDSYFSELGVPFRDAVNRGEKVSLSHSTVIFVKISSIFGFDNKIFAQNMPKSHKKRLSLK